MNGHSRKGVGADCIGFVGGVVDELYAIQTVKARPRIHKRSPLYDSGAHSELIKYLRRNWPSELVCPSLVEPGDVVICKVGQGEGHIMIVGPQENTLWHCLEGVGVCFTGFGLTEPLACYRLLEKHRWIS